MTAWLLMLAVSAGLSMNLVLQFGFGIREIAFAKRNAPERKPPNATPGGGGGAGLFVRLSVFFVSILLMWAAFSFARAMLPLGFLEYVLVFPTAFLFSAAWDYLSVRYLSGCAGRVSGDVFGGGALSGAALFVTLAVAGGFVEALVLSLGFTVGTLVAVAVVAEIGRRAAMEAVPGWLRGAPLALVAMGLLSLVFSSAAMVFFEVLGSG